MPHKFHHFRGLVWVISFIALLFVLFLFVDIQNVLRELGVRNSYLILFFVAMIGGASSITSSSYFATITALALNGLNPIAIAIVGGIGITVGDSLFYALGMWGRQNISGRFRAWTERWSRWLSRKPRWIVQIIIYLYTGFTPLPGDILMTVLSFSRFPFKSFIIPGLLGNITLVILIVIGVLFGRQYLSFA